MTDVQPAKLEAAYAQALGAITIDDLVALIPQIERFRATADLDAVIKAARPGAKVQRKFLPLQVQGEIFKVGLRSAKGQNLVQDTVIGLYYDELGDAVADPTLEQLASATTQVMSIVSKAIVQLTLLGVVARDEVAKPHAITVLRDQFDCVLA